MGFFKDLKDVYRTMKDNPSKTQMYLAAAYLDDHGMPTNEAEADENSTTPQEALECCLVATFGRDEEEPDSEETFCFEELTFLIDFDPDGECNGETVHIQCNQIMFVPEELRNEAAVILNAFNAQNRFATFQVDPSDGWIGASTDSFLGSGEDDAGKITYELLLAITTLVDEIYPLLEEKYGSYQPGKEAKKAQGKKTFRSIDSIKRF